jgi:hypothetical protein
MLESGPDFPAPAKSPELREVIAEFGRHLDILAEQLGASLLEADRKCMSVGDSFHELAAAKSALDAIGCAEPERSQLRDTGKQMGDSIHAAVVALQYHDRLVQRLGLVRAGLERLQTLLHDSSPRSFDHWLQSLRELERVNRTEQLRLGPDRSHGEPDDSPSTAASQSSVELF